MAGSSRWGLPFLVPSKKTCKMLKYIYLLILSFLASPFLTVAQVVFSEQAQSIGFDHDFKARALMGGGAAFFDYDNDGDEDMYVTSGLNKDELYRNNGNGTFTKIQADIGLNITLNYNTMGVTTGDIDNDGDRDIFIATWERFEGSEQPDARSLLFLNNGDGTFTEIGEQAGITHEAFAMGAVFLDYNKDGFLDVYVLNHIQEVIFTYDEFGAVDGLAHECYPNFLYLNNGDLTFTEVAAELGVDDLGCTIAAIASDYDLDNDLDLYLANDFGPFIVPNGLFENNYPEDSFSDVSEPTGTGIEVFGMGIAAGDYDHDQDLDYYITNIGRNILLENQNDIFADRTTEAGVENATVPEEDNLNTTGWGTAFFDVNNDTWEDLYVANGRIPTLPAFATAINDPDKLYLNNGDKTFTDISDEAGVSDPRYVHGMAYSDYDEDGDLDIVTVVLDELGGYSKFYVNETENDHHYLQLHLIGVETNRDAFGSRAWVYTDSLVLVKEIYGGGASHASQHTSVLHFGLGDNATVDSVRIEWTNGHVDLIENPEVDKRHTIVEGVEVTTTDAGKAELGIVAAPNPFTDHLELIAGRNWTGTTLSVRLMSLEGRAVFHQELPFTGQTQLDLPDGLAKGMYLLELIAADGTRDIFKVIKQ